MFLDTFLESHRDTPLDKIERDAQRVVVQGGEDL